MKYLSKNGLSFVAMLITVCVTFSTYAQSDEVKSEGTNQSVSPVSQPDAAMPSEPPPAVLTDPANTLPPSADSTSKSEAQTASETSEPTANGDMPVTLSSDTDNAATAPVSPAASEPAQTASAPEATNLPSPIVQQNVLVKPDDTALLAAAEKEAIESRKHLFVVTYSMAHPQGSTAKYIDKFSFQGFGFEYRYMLQKQLSIGASFHWNTFESKESDVFRLNANTTISGTRIKIADLIQIMPSIYYYLTPQSAKVVAFGGVSAGPHYTSQVIDWGWWYDRTTAWQFGFSPEAGIRIAALSIPLYLSVRYSYAFKTSEIDAQQTIGFNIGVAFLK